MDGSESGKQTNEAAQGPGAPSGISDNDDLFFEELTYNYLDIARIEIGSDCSIGKMRNLYDYDGNHRVINMQNIVFDPDPIEDRYNTNYAYDLAGNITRLNRNGLITNGTSPTFGIIDSLIYDYDLNDPSKLLSVTDSVPDATAQPKGFVAEYSGYLYDANGNVVSDGGKGLTIQYNLLNLPDSIRQDTAGAMAFEYTYGGQKIRRNLTGDEEEDRVYLAGSEFKDGVLEAYYHPEGRVVFEEDTLHYQYKIADHLGNTAVLFEDRDEDGLILTESSTSDSSLLEVLQRHYYYPFGMAMEGGWQDVAFPGNRYRYNGKELEGKLGLGWYAYGARWYDPTIGRFTGVDPIGEDFAWATVFNYAENEPIGHIDFFGLQKISVSEINIEKRSATATIRKIALIPTSGVLSISQHKEISNQSIRSIFNKGNTNVFVSQLPSQDSDLKIISRKEFHSGSGFKLKIRYDVSVERVKDFRVSSQRALEDPALYSGLLLGNERRFPEESLTAAYAMTEGDRNQIILNPFFFGENANKPMGLETDGKQHMTASEILAHELGIHNMAGEKHNTNAKGEVIYPSQGLESNRPGQIFPLKKETEKILLLNQNNIESHD
jgi:RHS repeat-associated protein